MIRKGRRRSSFDARVKNDEAKTALDTFSGMRMRTLRISGGHTQAWLSEVMGVTPNTLYAYETGEHKIPLARAYLASLAMGIRMEDLFEGAEGIIAEPEHYTRYRIAREQKSNRWAYRMAAELVQIRSVAQRKYLGRVIRGLVKLALSRGGDNVDEIENVKGL